MRGRTCSCVIASALLLPTALLLLLPLLPLLLLLLLLGESGPFVVAVDEDHVRAPCSCGDARSAGTGPRGVLLGRGGHEGRLVDTRPGACVVPQPVPAPSHK